MSYRKTVTGILFPAAFLLLAACQAATEPPTQEPTPVNGPANTTVPVTVGTTAVPTPAPADTQVPTATVAAPAPTSTPRAATATLVPQAGTAVPHKPATTPGGLAPPSPAVFYNQGGIVLEYYWPFDNNGNLSASETEILAYNETDEVIEFVNPRLTFSEGSITRAQTSGTWEKFPSRASWERSEYIQIPPSPYGGEQLRVLPGEKAKIHWHMEGVSSADTLQTASMILTARTSAGTQVIDRMVQRGTAQASSPPPVTATPAPTRAAHGTPEPSNTGSHGATSNVLWRFDGTKWAPIQPAPNCAEPYRIQTPVDMSLVTSALWSGQSRGGYKGRGGFRFDASSGDAITVRAPVSGHLVRASRYL